MKYLLGIVLTISITVSRDSRLPGIGTVNPSTGQPISDDAKTGHVSLLTRVIMPGNRQPDLAAVAAPPEAVRQQFGLADFYQKWTELDGFPIVSSAAVRDTALREARWLIHKMIGHRPDILEAMTNNDVRFTVMAYSERTTDVPEHSDLKPKKYWDRRARGLGATPSRPSVSCGEENLLKFPGDPYATENILIHEFGHAIHEMGLSTTHPDFDQKLKDTFDQAIQRGLWKDTYAATNKEEYWAEGVQSWFNTNRENDSDHNHINTRSELRDYDPGLSQLLAGVFGDRAWRYSPPATRSNLPHLRRYNPSTAPTFSWSQSAKQQRKDPEAQ